MENQNSVCYIGKVTEIKAIEGADNIELAIIGGWNCITKKGLHKADEFVIIATTDAVIPEELSEKLGVTGYLRKGNRVRTVKLRGVYSECLIIPLNVLEGSEEMKIGVSKQPWGDQLQLGPYDDALVIEEGVDVSEMLGIFKYEPPVRQVQLASGKKVRYQDNPNFHVYYKFPNLKNVSGMFTEEDIVQITRKIHGTNARYGIVKKNRLSFMDRIKKFFGFAGELFEYEYVYGSHNVEKGSDSQGFYSTDVWRTIAEKYDIKNRLLTLAKTKNRIGELGAGIVIYGEIYGAGIQKNYEYGLTDIEFVGFDATVNGKYESTIYTEFLFKEALELPHVGVLYTGPWSQETQDQFVFGNMIKGTKVPHEGIVIKHISGERNRVAKVINPDYLIYGEKHDIGDSH
jgi:RNA ligase (TIGR02306 family)